MSRCGLGYLAIWYWMPFDMMISYGLAGPGLGIAFPVPVNRRRAVRPDGKRRRNNKHERPRLNAWRCCWAQIVAVLGTSSSLYGLPALDGFTDAFVALGAFLLIAAFAARAVAVQSAARTTN
jgi:hypothetical protein